MTCKLIIPISEGPCFIGNYFHYEKVENHQHYGKSNWFRVLQALIKLIKLTLFSMIKENYLHFNIVQDNHFFN